jgi:hypothetical protein
MSDHDANRDEMDPSELTDADVELLRSGRAPDGVGNEELARFVDELRALYTTPPGETIERAQIAAIVEEAERAAARGEERTTLARQPEPSSKRRLAIPRKRLALLIAAVALGVALLAAGLAAAGVSLPGVARAPLEQLGIQPPNEASADTVTGAIDLTAPGRDCSFGQPIAAATNRGGQGPAGGLCSGEAANTSGQDARDDVVGRSFGQQTSESARGSASTGERVFGQQTSPAA